VLKRATKRRDDDSGSLIIAISVIMILVTLSMAGLARTLSTLKAARSTEDFQRNLSYAETGLSDLLFRLDQGERAPTNGANPVCVPGCSMTKTTSTYRYTATRYTNPDVYTFKGVGTKNGRSHAIQVTLTRQPKFGYGLYTVQGMNLSTGAIATIHGYLDPVTGECTRAIIGSSGTITLKSGANSSSATGVACGQADPRGGGDGQDTFNGSGCSTCYTTTLYRGSGDYQNLAPAQAPTITPVVIPSSAQAKDCSSLSGQIPTGTWVCNGDISLSGDATIDQTGAGVTLYVKQGYSFLMQSKNMNWPSGGAGDASKLEVFMVGGGSSSFNYGGGGAPRLSAIVFAPGTDLIANGQDFSFTGSMTLDSATPTGNAAGFNFYYDKNTARPTLSWNLDNYSEIPSSQVP
jgi:hypothetical protein